MDDKYLKHYGVKGQKHGVRRYQNKDGSYTPLGREHYGVGQFKTDKVRKNDIAENDQASYYNEKRASATKHIENTYNNTEDILEIVKYQIALSKAKDEKEFRDIMINHPAAKKYEEAKGNFLYSEASPKLKKVLDNVKEEASSEDWMHDEYLDVATYDSGTSDEWNALMDAFNESYNSLVGKIWKSATHSDISISEDELYHAGVKGQKWGVRRYQNLDGSLTPAGRIHYGVMSVRKGKTAAAKARSDDAKTIKREVAAEKAKATKLAKQKEAEEKKKREEEKQQALKTGTAADILKFKGEISNEEMQKAISRLNLEQQLNSINEKDINRGKQTAQNVISNNPQQQKQQNQQNQQNQQKTKVEKKSALDKMNTLMTDIDKIRGMAEKGINAWNVAAKINNTFNKDFKMPTVDGSDYRKKEADKATKTAREEHLRTVTRDEVVENLDSYSLKELQDLEKRFNVSRNIKNMTVIENPKNKKKQK